MFVSHRKKTKKTAPAGRSSGFAQAGNAFFFILLGVVLFAALSYTIARGMRSQTTATMSNRDALLNAADIVSYSERVARAVDRVRRNGCSENQITFENDFDTAGYTNADAPGDNSCHIFHPDGGSVSWQISPVNSTNFVFWGSDAVSGLGTTNSELIMALNLGDNLTLCKTLNTKLGIASIANEGGDDTFAKFDGSFADSGVTMTGNAGVRAACFDEDGGGAVYYFYYVLLER